MEKLKIIYLGNVDFPHSSENSVVRQLVREGHNVTPFQYGTTKDTNYYELNKKLFATLGKEKFDLMIGTKCMGLKREHLAKIKIPKVSFTFDLFQGYDKWQRYEWYEAQTPGWNVCFGAEKCQVEHYKKLGVNYYALKIGADPEWHKKVPFDDDYNQIKCDVSFLGGIYNPLRINMNSRIEVIPHITYKNFVGYELRGSTVPGIYMEQISHLANVCKITIGCNYRNDIEGYWSKRPYELMGSNLFMIQAKVKGMEEEGFKHKVNTVFFENDDFDKMAEYIQYYLREENEEERNKIREAGYQLIHDQHMQSHRNKVFFKVLKSQGII